MENVQGVSSVEIWGGADRQIQVLLDPSALAEGDLTAADVRDAMRARNRDVKGASSTPASAVICCAPWAASMISSPWKA